MNDRSPIRVIKLGGSLLELGDLPTRLRIWLSRQLPMANLLVVGGGRFADAVRHYDARLQLGDERAHALAIAAMSLATQLASRLVSHVAVLRDLDRAAIVAASTAFIDPAPLFANGCHPALAALPQSWNVTSDSIAAAVAESIAASELAVLKSTLPDRSLSRQTAAHAELVDTYFPIAARKVARVRIVNLREECFPDQILA